MFRPCTLTHGSLPRLFGGGAWPWRKPAWTCTPPPAGTGRAP